MTAAIAEIGGDLQLTQELENGLLALDPPRDLIRRMSALPASYLKEREVTKRLNVTQDPAYALAALEDGSFRPLPVREPGIEAIADLAACPHTSARAASIRP